MAIIGILAALITVSVNIALTNAKIAKAEQDIQTFTQAAQTAESNTGEALGQITGNYCSDCVCRTLGNMDNLSDSSTCVQNWYAVLQSVQNACNGGCNNIIDLKRDPWGAPYALDENELEGSPTNCTRDILRSVGPDGLWGGSDDIIVDLPFATGTCANQ